MFSPSRNRLETRRSLRSRLVRGLDVAVELVTLGEYGVEEIPIEAPADADADGWTWPPRASGGALAPGQLIPRLRPPARTCPAATSRAAVRSRGGAVPAARLGCDAVARDGDN